MEYLISKGILRRFDKTQFLFHGSTVFGFIIIGMFLLYGFKKGIFVSSEAFSEYMIHLGYWAPALFIAVQAIQVVIPILPGAIGCVAGVIAFGPVYGFLFSYIGISLGSVAAFIIAKQYGIATVKKLVSPKLLEKYFNWLEKDRLFDKLFAGAIFAPVAPDDFLCYLAGLTKMSLKKFTVIIILCKPFSIVLYSLGLTGILKFFGI